MSHEDKSNNNGSTTTTTNTTSGGNIANNSNNTSLLQESNHSARSIHASTIRSVLREASTLALRQSIEKKRAKAALLVQDERLDDDDDHNHPVDGETILVPVKTEKKRNTCDDKIRIEEEDLESAYEIALRVGRKWRDKLVIAGEEEFACLLEEVMRNGRFLERSFVDDITVLPGDDYDHAVDGIVGDDNSNGNSEKDGGGKIDKEQSARNEHNVVSDETEKDGSTSGDLIMTRNSNDTAEEQPSTMVQQLPFFATLSQLGCHDPCNLEYYASPRIPLEMAPLTGTEWTPLPASDPNSATDNDGDNHHHSQASSTDDGNLVHIPYPMIQPPSLRKAQPPNQLYGYPAPTLHLQHTNDRGEGSIPAYFLTGEDAPRLRDEFLKSQIRLLDRVILQSATTTATMGDTVATMTDGSYWNYGWDVIQFAAERNRRRLYLETISGRKRKASCVSRQTNLEIVPRMFLPTQVNTVDAVADDDDDTVAVDNTSIKRPRQQQQQQPHKIPLDQHVTTTTPNQQNGISQTVPLNSIMPQRIMRRISQQDKKRARNLSITTIHPGAARRTPLLLQLPSRPPSSTPQISECTFDDIHDEFSENERDELIKTMMHSETDADRSLEEGYSQIQGAMKILGSVHMWEQMVSGEWSGPQFMEEDTNEEDEDEERRREAERRKERIAAMWYARRQRLGRGCVVRNDRKNTMVRSNSKVVWADTVLTKRRSVQPKTGEKLNNGWEGQWMQMDLGECTIAMMVPSSTTINEEARGRREASTSSLKRMLAFRSLEVSLKF